MTLWRVPAAASEGCAEEGLAPQRMPLSIKPHHSSRTWASLTHPDTRNSKIMQYPPNLIIFYQGADDQTPRGSLEDAFWSQMRHEESPQALQPPTSLLGLLLPQGCVEGCVCFMVPYTNLLALEHSQISRYVRDFMARSHTTSLQEVSREFFRYLQINRVPAMTHQMHFPEALI